MTDRPLITPETKVGALLDAYPELEAVLIELAPPFRKLKNPVLRRTVARLTSLAQAAKVGGIDVRELVLTLRRSVGQGDSDLSTSAEDSGEILPAPPTWLTAEKVVVSLDADELLATDALPLEAVTRRLRSTQSGEWLELRSSFHPAPLIDALRQQRRQVICVRANGGAYLTYVSPDGDAPS